MKPSFGIDKWLSLDFGTLHLCILSPTSSAWVDVYGSNYHFDRTLTSHYKGVEHDR